ncbi:NAD(+) diphosphatase [Fodinicurvata sp. EGI_FJ10296]|uniref:NAD(+) diphosphatase n=1 Tax=Fodinicurvata sp. EGI_FJ10296 TaxID=3231908 RepID=UPI003456DD1A
MTRIILYASDTLDRGTQHRSDDNAIARRLSDPDALVLPVWRGQHLRPGEVGDVTIAADALPGEFRRWLLENADYAVYLGQFGDRPVIATGLSALAEEALISVCPATWTPVSLRTISPLVDHHEAALLAYAQALVWWRDHNRFCGVCGHRTVVINGGHAIRCADPDCNHTIFPRTDPAVIVLVHDGDRALLGRPAHWPAGLHSVIAGFVEPGETIEGAVRREVAEETGIIVDEVSYRDSQPWPFPQSLMLGFRARATTREISLNDQELEHAAWYDRQTLMAVDRNADPATAPFALPRGDSIARRLIEEWLQEV